MWAVLHLEEVNVPVCVDDGGEGEGFVAPKGDKNKTSKP